MNMDPLETCTEDPAQFFKDWIRQISSPDDKLMKKLQFEFESLDEDTSNIFPWLSRSEENVKKIIVEQMVVDEDFPDNCVFGSIYFEDRSVFNGIFKEDLSYRHGKLFENANSDRGTKGTWVEGLLEGLTQTDNEYGGYELAFYKSGLQHGIVVEFGPIRSKNFMKCCFYQNGEPYGLCFKVMVGGGFMVGRMFEDTISDNQAAIVFPSHKAAMIGVVVEDAFVRGKEVEVVGVRLENGIPVPVLSKPKSSIIYKRDVSDSKNISKWPYLKDPWEHIRVEARASNVSGAGEGLFTKGTIETDKLVALYNGTRAAPSLKDEWSDYRQGARILFLTIRISFVLILPSSPLSASVSINLFVSRFHFPCLSPSQASQVCVHAFCLIFSTFRNIFQ